jgi:DNA-binding transcriptional ArsR family regulator
MDQTPDNSHELLRQRTVEDFFAAFAEPVRLTIFRFLVRMPTGLNLQAIAGELGIRPSVCSHHLNILVRSGLAIKEPVGGLAWYKINVDFYEQTCLSLLMLVPRSVSKLPQEPQ